MQSTPIIVASAATFCTYIFFLRQKYGRREIDSRGHVASRLDARGVSVVRKACSAKSCQALREEILHELEQRYRRPKTMAERNRQKAFRHFFPVSLDSSVVRDGMLPVSPTLFLVLTDLLSGELGLAMASMLGVDFEIFEVLFIVSESGALAQSTHSDGEYDSISLSKFVTVFVALQDIHDESLGPTYFVPDTHEPSCFPSGRWIGPDPASASKSKHIWIPLNTGDATCIFSTTWHRGSSQHSFPQLRPTANAVWPLHSALFPFSPASNQTHWSLRSSTSLHTPRPHEHAKVASTSRPLSTTTHRVYTNTRDLANTHLLILLYSQLQVAPIARKKAIGVCWPCPFADDAYRKEKGFAFGLRTFLKKREADCCPLVHRSSSSGPGFG